MWHIFKYHSLSLLRNKAIIFWTLLFPIVLATLFYFAFSNLSNSDNFTPFEIGIIENESYHEEIMFQKVIKEASKDGNNKMFSVKKYVKESDALEDVKKNKITGFYQVKEEIELTVISNGINETIMKNLLDKYNQTKIVVENIMVFNVEAFTNDIYNQMAKSENYLNDVTNKNPDSSVIYFYTLIAMVCMYAAMYGMNLITMTEANLSKKGARISASPMKKGKILVGSLLSGWAIQYVFSLILLVYMTFILKIDFGTQIIPILALMLIANLSGVSLGIFIGVCSKKNENLKTSILISIIMLGCFLSGMMILDIKYLIAQYVPFLAYINPVSVITDALYSLYYYNDLSRYYFNIMNLLIFILVMSMGSIFFLRRKKYDSI